MIIVDVFCLDLEWVHLLDSFRIVHKILWVFGEKLTLSIFHTAKYNHNKQNILYWHPENAHLTQKGKKGVIRAKRAWWGLKGLNNGKMSLHGFFIIDIAKNLTQENRNCFPLILHLLLWFCHYSFLPICPSNARSVYLMFWKTRFAQK